MNRLESPIERAHLDVAKAERRVAYQAARLEQMKIEGRDTTLAEAILDSHKALLRFLREDLEYLETKGNWSWH